MKLTHQHSTRLVAAAVRLDLGLERLQNQVIAKEGDLVDDPERFLQVVDAIDTLSGLLEGKA